MSGEQPSFKQTFARKAQSEADRSGKGKAAASAKQSEADAAAVRKHGV
ncbi:MULTISPECIES: hypothetical protein [Paenibacillus]|nr:MULTISPECIES: hypothetical protein [Paenibacillus]CDN43619.1 hypothetical protein BN871_DF_00460 [Paenibacillus sp. P22]SIQ87280.1 hypothetical protein SAMN05880555_2576 [Paenibacillus sp. RU4X]SIR08488.1 hypothetical protein SAMN05880570_2575 [Paenibacillus sp. RU4T]